MSNKQKKNLYNKIESLNEMKEEKKKHYIKLIN